jgi:hypothetical protein
MTEEDEEFNRIEREAAMRKEAVAATVSAPVQEPVAWIDAEKRTFEWNGPVLWNTPTVAVLDKIPLYTTPPAAPVQEPVAWGVFEGGNLHDMFFTKEEADNMAYLKGSHAEVKPLTTPPAAQRTERNFCERCGKRLLKGFHIHTCTPPKENT